MIQSKYIFILALVALTISLVACGGKPAAITDIPVYTGAVELKPGESNIADTLSKNGAQDSAIRKSLNVGGSTVQKGFDVPKETTWAMVQSFYNDQMKAARRVNSLM